MSFVKNLLGKFKKKSDDFDDFDDFDVDEDDMEHPDGEGAVPAPSAVRDDDDDRGGDPDFDDFDDDFDMDGDNKKGKLAGLLQDKKKLAIAAGGLVAVLGLGGAGAWFFMGDSPDETAQEEGLDGGGISLAIPQTRVSGLTPQAPGAVALSTPATSAAKFGANSPKAAAPASRGNNPAAMGGYDPSNPKAPLAAAAVGEVGISVPAVLPQALASLGPAPAPQPLNPPNDQSLFEKGKHGVVPIVSESGNEPWKAYARPFKGDQKTPSIGLIVTGLGLSQVTTQAAIDHLPADVTLSFSPYGTNLKTWVEKARAMGHEVLIDLPMEAETFPNDDPGPVAMSATKGTAENLQNLDLILPVAQGYVGFIGTYGSKFSQSETAVRPVIKELKTRGLLIVDPNSSPNSVILEIADREQLPRARVDMQMQSNTGANRFNAQLQTLATLAKSRGLAIAALDATPVNIKLIKDWSAGLDGVQLAPITSLSGRQN